ncbi:hypothetical protein BC831DRAFT_462311 [Entophlyctis helioformis]|nr:hypothetical protein BC831DRAFT_462311 [Entophlyctis helioformis]
MLHQVLEAIQIANMLDANGVPCWLFIGEKEGHVFKQTSVQEQHAIAMVHFLDTQGVSRLAKPE